MGGGHDLLNRRKAAGESPLHDHIVPGKSTGVPIVDKGTVCERHPEKKDCWLDKDDRTRLLLSLETVVGAAMDNFHAAIQNVRTDLLTMTGTQGSWGLIAEIIFGTASSGIVMLLSKSLSAFAAEAAAGKALIGDGYEIPTTIASAIGKLRPTHITKMLIQASKGVRTALKNAAHKPKGVSKEDAAAADFCTIVEEGISPLVTHLVLDAPTKLDDFEIAAMVASYQDPTYHSIAAYETVMRDLVDRFKEQRLVEIGDGLSNGTDQMSDTKAVMVLGKGGVRRVAIVEFYNPIYGDNNTRYHRTTGQPTHWNQPEFKSWVDKQLEPVATSTQFDRYGDMPVIDATAEATGMAPIDTWAADPTKDVP
jgi:protein-tyrosine-phosphatase